MNALATSDPLVGHLPDSVIAYHNDFKDNFGVNMPMVVANDPLVVFG